MKTHVGMTIWYVVFEPDDAREILSISIRADMEDWVAWHFDNKGLTGWVSVYRMLGFIVTRAPL